MGKLGGFQVFCPINEVWPIEICDVVPYDYVRIHLFNEVPPSMKELCFVIKREDLGTNDVRTGVKREHIPDEGLRLACSKYLLAWSSCGGDGDATLTSYHVRNLDDGISVGLGEYTFSPSTLNIEAEYA